MTPRHCSSEDHRGGGGGWPSEALGDIAVVLKEEHTMVVILTDVVGWVRSYEEE